LKLERVVAIDKKIMQYTNIDTLFVPGGPRVITFVNTFSYYQLVDAHCPIEKIDVVFVDGILQVGLHNMFVRRKINRASFDFSSLAHDFFRYVIANRLQIALIGATEAEIRLAVVNIKAAYPDVPISFFRNGYFLTDRERQTLVQTAAAGHIDVMILGMGTPLQEQTAVFLKERLPHMYVVTCGGFITQTAQGIDHYWKKWRWLQRAVEYPHVRKRILYWYPRNVVRYCIDHIVLWFNNQRRKRLVHAPVCGL
jgi:N-acetylglucosaminyldiphosphoundecaprenol N-acetyl-beta-D-mannosaminyltransferase